MIAIGYPDLHHVRSAEGWLELGDPGEAVRELDRVSLPAGSHPDLLELRWRIHAAERDWEKALATARDLCRLDPDRPTGWIHASYCLHELRRTAEAWENLLPQAGRFPGEVTIAYNLACYACQLGRIGTAREWIGRSVTLAGGDAVRALAREDPDLEPLRDFLGTL